MAVPKRKVTPSKRGMRRSHDRVATPAYAECDNCGELKLPHHLCNACGQYRGRQIFTPKSEIIDTEDDTTENNAA